MSIVQTFYDNMASHYDKLFADWQSTTREQAEILDQIFRGQGFDKAARILDCACGIGTQAIGRAAMGYDVTGSDLSQNELEEAKVRAAENGVSIPFVRADFRALEESLPQCFDIIIAMDNALPHMLTREDLEVAVNSMVGRLQAGGLFVASIRDYDAMLETKPPYSPPYIHQTEKGQRVSFQTWHWDGDSYLLKQYIIEDEDILQIGKFECMYRAARREELTELLLASGCKEVKWLFPEETDFYQPIVIART